MSFKLGDIETRLMGRANDLSRRPDGSLDLWLDDVPLTNIVVSAYDLGILAVHVLRKATGGKLRHDDAECPTTSKFAVAPNSTLERIESTAVSSACCEDCPEVNPKPPQKSECLYFEISGTGVPVCTREDSMNSQLNRHFGSIGIDNTD